MSRSAATPRPLLTGPAVLAALALVAAAAVAVLLQTSALGQAGPGSHDARPAGSSAVQAAAGSPRRSGLQALEEHTRVLPQDPQGWTALGLAELEQGRATGDPAHYNAAGEAFDTALRVRPDAASALAGQAALADARHDFTQGLDRALKALALNPSSPEALAAQTDALTELGRYDQALAAARRLDTVRPGLISFSRLSYQAELRGDLPRALTLMRQAADEARSPEQVAFARSHEGLIALGAGDRAGAQAALRSGLLAAAQDPALLFLRAKVAWAAGEREQAAIALAELVTRRPTLTYATAQAEVLGALGRPAEAAQALTLARAAARLASGAGVAPEGIDVLAEVDHGDPQRALTLAEGLWSRTRSVGAADSYAWALHAAGRDREARGFADRALALGGHPSLTLYHRGVILAALGQRAAAVQDLRAALRQDPTFSALHAPRAEQLLRSLGGAR